MWNFNYRKQPLRAIMQFMALAAVLAIPLSFCHNSYAEEASASKTREAISMAAQQEEELSIGFTCTTDTDCERKAERKINSLQKEVVRLEKQIAKLEAAISKTQQKLQVKKEKLRRNKAIIAKLKDDTQS